jgi:hypothetical protein
LSPTADAIAAKAPDVVTAIAGQAVVFSLAAGTGFSVKAPDLSGSDQVAVRLDVIGGRSSLLLVGSDSGLTWTDADGADGSLAFSGSLDAVNAALAAGVRASVEVGKVRLSVSDQIGQSAAVATVKGGLGAQTGQYIIGDGSGGGGGGGIFDVYDTTPWTDTQLGPGKDGGKGGGGPDMLMGTAGYDIIFGDGSGGGGGGGLIKWPGGQGGSAGGGADHLLGGAGNDVLFGDGFAGQAAQIKGGWGGLGGGGGGGGGSFNTPFLHAAGGMAGLGGGGGWGDTSQASMLIDGLGDAQGNSLATADGRVGLGGLDGDIFFLEVGRAGGGAFGGATGGDSASYGAPLGTGERLATAGANGDTQVHQVADSDGSIYRYMSTLQTLRQVLSNYPEFGAGEDTLNGGAGSDDMFGLGGNDTFVVDVATADTGDIDRIWDFEAADRLVLRNGDETWQGDGLQGILLLATVVDSDGDGAVDDLRIRVPSLSGIQSVAVDLINVTALRPYDGTLVLPNSSPTGAATLGGNAVQNQTLTAGHNLADLDGLGSLGYQWFADGQAIEGARQDTLRLTQAEVGKAITVTAIYTDARGFQESVTSAATEPVANVNDAPTGTVSISGKPEKGQTLTASHTVSDPDGLGEILYRWSSGPVLYSEVTGSSYTLTQDNVGQPISVAVQYTDGGGKLETVQGETLAIVTVPSYARAQFWRDAAKAPSDLKKPAAVDLNDAIAILKMIVGLPVNSNGTPLSAYQAVAADFDQTGEVNLTDAIGVLKMIVGLAAPAPQWKYFDDAKLAASYKPADVLKPKAWLGDAALADISAVAADVKLVGVLAGDVDGSWTGV